MDDNPPPPPEPTRHQRRLQLVWSTVVFQLKLAADGVLDLALSPVSMVAAIAGLVAGGDEPDRYLRRVQHAGRRIERWINLFGRHRRDSADTLLAPLEERLKDEYARGGWVTRSARQVNTLLDSLNAPATSRADPDAPSPADSTEPPAASSVKDERPPR